MKADLSRQTFKVDKHYSSVIMQQGRVQLDADWNEQQAIARHRVEIEAADAIGPSGAPKTSPGFQITLQGNDLRIGKGHFYVDGILCVNENDVLFNAQPDLWPIDQSLLPTAEGLYVAYLETWERHITALEDQGIRETALGVPDTGTRTKTVWQVRLLRVTDPGGAVTCDTSFAEWTALLQQNLININNVGRMSAQSQPEEPSPDPLCILPPGAGYRRLENQLYRVEIHTGGDRTQARFKWSRDNGTVASAIVPDENSVVISGSVIEVAEIGKDGMLTFASDPLPEWLELTDDRYELLNQRGTLARVQDVDPATRRITFVPGTLPSLDAAQHPIVRRWDQRDQTGAGGASATADGVAMTGGWQQLEDGVEVRFADGMYRAGDFWQIPARTAIGFETGNVEWSRAGANPLPEMPHGTRHHFVRLALLRLNGGTFTLVPGAEDCRKQFPPLTAITAVDVSFSDATCQLGNTSNVQQVLDVLCQRNGSHCNLLVSPGEDLATAVRRLDGVQDAMICLRAGTYELKEPLRIENRGNVQIVGAGFATRIIAPESESALVFVSCSNVTVRDCFIQSGVVGHGTAKTEDLNGTLTFLNCFTVRVEQVRVECAGGPLRAATCITARRDDRASINSEVQIQDCRLVVGHQQTGILIINTDRGNVTDNMILSGKRPAVDTLVQDTGYRGLVRHGLISHIVRGKSGTPPPANTNATVTFNNQTVHFQSAQALIHSDRNDNEWQRAITAVNPTGIRSPRLAERFLLQLASDLVRTRGSGTGGSAILRNVIENLLEQDIATASQGIVFAGQVAANITITGNRVRDAMQCVHVGLSDDDGSVWSADVVVIRDNMLRVSLPTTAVRDRHGIFVGNCKSLVIESNYIDVVRASQHTTLPVQGIRIFGIIGGRMIVRHNHMGKQFQVGVTFAPLNSSLPASPLWIITENVMESSSTKVDVPSTPPGNSGPSNPLEVRKRVRGINDNFA